jgi:hypothetical protein
MVGCRQCVDDVDSELKSDKTSSSDLQRQRLHTPVQKSATKNAAANVKAPAATKVK